MKYVVADRVGVDLDDAYPWDRSLLATSGIAGNSTGSFEECHSRVVVRYTKNIAKSECREVADRIYTGSSAFISDEYGIRLTFPDSNTVVMETRQECDEWFMILLQAMLLRSGLSMIHAAAVCKEDTALLMPSWGGVGKTACVTRLIKEHGWKLLGDDIVLISADAEVMGLPKHFVIYPYHRPLFPELFSQGKGPISPKSTNDLLTKVGRVVKPALRMAPGLLALARRHNPQSRRVSPFDIFGKSNIGTHATAKRAVWLERAIGEVAEPMNRMSPEKMASMSASVTLMEVAGPRLPAMCALLGSGLLDCDDFFGKTYQIHKQAYDKIGDLHRLTVPADVPVEQVPDWVITHVTTED